MTTSLAPATLAALLFCLPALAQTPEQEKTWAADRERAAAADRLTAEQLARERTARRADPMAWVRTLDPMTAGGWEFRSVAPDGASAIFSSTHQIKRSGQTVMVWMRHEYAEAQTADSGPYLSAVEKVQYDCKKQQERTWLVIYYAANNVQGGQQTEEADGKNTPWNSIVPGTPEEANFSWACNQGRTAAK